MSVSECVEVRHVHAGAIRGHKKASDPLEPELLVIVSHYAGARRPNRVFTRTGRASSLGSTPTSQHQFSVLITFFVVLINA